MALLLMSATCLLAQKSVQHSPDVEDVFDEVNLWRTVRRFLLPRRQYLTYELREYIALLPLRNHHSRLQDLQRVDYIYLRSLYLSEGDIELAMFICALATLPYHRFPAVIPLLDLEIVIPVSTESRSSYNKRLANLPGILFVDSPAYLDRDKLPHFFGSAYLQILFRDPVFVEELGRGIESAEEIFKLEGFRDPRDIRANRLGVLFAVQLQKHRHVLPSQIFLKSEYPAGMYLNE